MVGVHLGKKGETNFSLQLHLFKLICRPHYSNKIFLLKLLLHDDCSNVYGVDCAYKQK